MHVYDHATVLPLWPNSAPGSENWSQREQETFLPRPSEIPETFLPLPFQVKIARNIVHPTLTLYLPDPSIATGAAVIVCPGGVFHFLAIELEGTEVARWLCERGIAAFVLKYRVAQTTEDDVDLTGELQKRFANPMELIEVMQQIEPLAVTDGVQAVKVVRQNATEWGISPDRIGILGFSSGGVIAASVAMHSSEESRPDFVAPIYLALSGMNITVPADAPPLFLLAAGDDQMAVGSSLPLYSAWKDASRSVELHLYAQGGHGFGMKKQNLPVDHWIERFRDWLQGHNFLSRTF